MRSLSMTVTTLLAALVCGCPRLLAQAQGYIVISPISNGPADVYVNGQKQAQSLSDRELQIGLPVGTYSIVVRKYGYGDVAFQAVSVRANDVTPLTAVLRPAAAQAMREETVRESRQLASLVRLVHLGPSTVPVTGMGVSTETPVVLRLPVGENQLTIGFVPVCLNVPPLSVGDTAFVQVASGRVAVTERLSLCTARPGVEAGSLPAAAAAPGRAAPTTGASEVVQGIAFVEGSVRLSRTSDRALNRLATTLRASGSGRWEISAYTSAVGGSAVELLRLSQERADTVKSRLVSLGVPADNLTAVGYGARYPIASNRIAAGRLLNSRVEIRRLE